MYLDIDELKKNFPILTFYIEKYKNEFYNLDKNNIISTFTQFKNEFINNIFITQQTKIDIVKYLNNIVRQHYLENKYFNLWRNNLVKNKILNSEPVNQYDLEFNHINLDDKTNIVYINFSNGRKYIFTQKDFTKIIENCLFHSWEYDYLADPIHIKNPYEHHIFTKEELKHIDSQLIKPPIVWSLFKDSNYEILTLKENYNHYLLKNCLPSFINSLENEDYIYYLEDIIIYLKIYRKNIICSECLNNPSIYRSRKIKKVIEKWLLSIKFEIEFSKETIDIFKNTFKKPCKIHDKSTSIISYPKPFILNNSFIFNIDSSIINFDFSKDENNLFLFQSSIISYTNKLIKKNRNRVLKRILPTKVKKEKKFYDFKFDLTNVSSYISVNLIEIDGKIKVELSENSFNNNRFIKTIL